MAIFLNEITASAAAADDAGGFDIGIALKLDSMFSSVLKEIFEKSPELFSGSKHIGEPDATVSWKLTQLPTISLFDPDSATDKLVAIYKAQYKEAMRQELTDKHILEILRSAAQAGISFDACRFQLEIVVKKGGETTSLKCELEFAAMALLSISSDRTLKITPIYASLVPAAQEVLTECIKKMPSVNGDPVRDLVFFLIDAAVLPMAMQKFQDRLVFPIPDKSFHGLALTGPQLSVTPDRKHFVITARAISDRPQSGSSGAPLQLDVTPFPDKDAAVVVSREFVNLAVAAAVEAQGDPHFSRRGTEFGFSYELNANLHIGKIDVLLTEADGIAVNLLAGNGAKIRAKGAFDAYGELIISTRHLSFSIGFTTETVENAPFSVEIKIVNGAIYANVSTDFRNNLKMEWKKNQQFDKLIPDFGGALKRIEASLLRKITDYLNSLTYSKLILDALPLIPLNEIGGIPYDVAFREMELGSCRTSMTMAVNLQLTIPIPVQRTHRYKSAIKFNGRFRAKTADTYLVTTDPPGDPWIKDDSETGFSVPVSRSGSVDVWRYYLKYDDSENPSSSRRRHFYGDVGTNDLRPRFNGQILKKEFILRERIHSGGNGAPDDDWDAICDTAFCAYRSPRSGAVAVHFIFKHVTPKDDSIVVTNLVTSSDLSTWTRNGWTDGGVVFYAPKALPLKE